MKNFTNFILSIILLLFSSTLVAGTNKLSVWNLDEVIPATTIQNNLLVYELAFFNSSGQALYINRVEVRDEANHLLLALAGDKLRQDALIYKDDKRLDLKSFKLDDFAGAFVYMYIPLPKGKAIPKNLHHKIWVVETDKKVTEANYKILPLDVKVNNEKPPVLGMPLNSYNWVAEAAISNDSYHRRSILPIEGKFYLAQRFAIDWVQICDDGREVHGNMNDNNNWVEFGHEVLAVADGVVSKMQDVIRENNVPPHFPNPPFPIDKVPGNYVLLKIQQNNQDYYVLYAHMQPGSIKVKEGEQVSKGQVIGLLGNTGNSSAPHLHLHVIKKNDPLKASGVPFVFENVGFQGSAGKINTDYGLWIAPTAKLANYTHILPADGQTFQFSNETPAKCRLMQHKK